MKLNLNIITMPSQPVSEIVQSREVGYMEFIYINDVAVFSYKGFRLGSKSDLYYKSKIKWSMFKHQKPFNVSEWFVADY